MQFLTNKYANMYYKIISSPDTSDIVESHHIIPKCLGGIDMVNLSPRQHFICHLLLTKMFNKNTIEHFKMSYAFTAMTNLINPHTHSRYKCSSRIYSIGRNGASEAMKLRWKDPIFRAKSEAAMKLGHNNDITRKLHIDANIKRWQDSDYKSKVSKSIKSSLSTKEHKKMRSELRSKDNRLRRWINNGTKNKFVYESDSINLDDGWMYGRLSENITRVWINNEGLTRFVKEAEILQFISQGWSKGRTVIS